MGHKLANNPFSVHNNKVSERRNLFLWMIWLEFSCKLFEWNIRKEKYCIFSCDWDSVDILNLVSVQDWRRDNALSWQLAGRHQTCKRDTYININIGVLDTIGALSNGALGHHWSIAEFWHHHTGQCCHHIFPKLEPKYWSSPGDMTGDRGSDSTG